ncbi:MAG: hypothetical protein CMJ75_19235 [Planctomycetaceae bacterium]|nr:hypothetical protein [Planctomycetaceae bacterium]
MSNFGIGIGSFMDGFQRGANSYSQIQDARQQRKIRDQQFKMQEQELADQQQYREISEQAVNEAKQARQADIGKSIYRGSPDSPAGPVVPDYKVGNKSFANEADAQAEAEKSVGGFMDYYMKTAVPKLQEHWLATGQPEKAQIMGQWMEQEDVKKGMKAWAGAVRAFQVGDREAFKTNLMAAYNQSGYYDDGYEAIGIKDIEKDGNLLGYAITFKGPDGKEFTQEFDGDDVGKMGLYALAPDKVLEYGLEQVQAGQEARAKMAEKKMDFDADIAKETHKSNLRTQEEQAKQQMNGGSDKVREARAIAEELRSLGYDDDFIRQSMPVALGVERRGQSAADRLSETLEGLRKNDTTFKFSKLPPDEQVRQAQAVIEAQDRALRKQQQPAPSPGAQQPRPNVQSGGGIPIYDRSTGQTIYR